MKNWRYYLKPTSGHSLQPYLIYLPASRWTSPELPVFLEKHTVLSDMHPAHPHYYSLTLRFIPSPGKKKGERVRIDEEKRRDREQKNIKQRDKRMRM